MRPDYWIKLALAAVLGVALGLVAVPVGYAIAHVLTGAGRQGRGWDDVNRVAGK